MKKVLGLIIVVAMLLGMSSMIFAVDVPSAEGELAPTLEDYDIEGGEGLKLVVTPYAKRAKLPAELKTELEDAFKQLKNASNLSAVIPGIDAVAAELGKKVDDLAISDLFDASVFDTNDNYVGWWNKKVTFTLSSKKGFANVAAIVHFVDGKAEIVEDVKINGNKMTITVDGLSPFAIVKYTKVDPPQTADFNFVPVVIVAIVVLGGAFVVLAKTRKESAN